MSKIAKIVGAVAGVVAVVATGGAALGLAAGLAGIGQAAAAVAGVANVVAQMTAKKPRAQGSVSSITVGANQPMPYLMGRCYSGGAEIHRRAFGGTVDKVPNPYMARTIVYSCAGPVDGIEALQADFATISFSGTAASGYYSGFLWADTQLGARPESDALAAAFAGEPDWSSAHKLSGQLAVKWTLKFDKKGKVYSSGQPQFGLIARGVKVYDPRLDSTQPGGSGSCRLATESTWVYSTNPALHAGTYAWGRRENGVIFFGPGLESIDWANVAAWANLCDDNGWSVGGTIYEPGEPWNNLKLIAQAGGAVPGFSGAMLVFDFESPRVSLDTITADDLAPGDFDLASTAPYAQRLNSVVPRYVSEDHKWEMVQSDAVSDAAMLAEDGEPKDGELPLELVTDKDQAAVLAAYYLHGTREIPPFTLTLKPRFFEYRVGDCLTVDLPEYADDPFDVVVTARTIDPASMTVILELRGETGAKHALALAATGTAPPPALIVTGEDRDGVTGTLSDPAGYNRVLINGAVMVSAHTLTGSDAGSSATITVGAGEWDYSSTDGTVTRAGGSITGQAFASALYVYFDDDTLADTTPTYAATADYETAVNSATNPARHFVGMITTPAGGAADTSGTVWGGVYTGF